MKLRYKMFFLLGIFLAVILFGCFGLTSSASTSSGTDYNSADKSKFSADQKWEAGRAKHWTYSFPTYKGMWWWKKIDCYYTYNFIRLEDSKGNLIPSDKMTYLYCKYEINGKKYVVESKIVDNTFSLFKNMLTFKKQDPERNNPYGLLVAEPDTFDNKTIQNPDDNLWTIKTPLKVFKNENYQSTNLCWKWIFDSDIVTDIMEMYVWYKNDKSEEIATSFIYKENTDGTLIDGIHPVYENDKMVGVYDVNNNLLDNYYVNEIGLICDAAGDEIDLSNEQTKGSIIVPVESGVLANMERASKTKTIFTIIISLIGGLILLGIFIGIASIINAIKK